MAQVPQLPDLTDKALIRRFLAGEEEAFRALHARHTPRLRMLVRRVLGSRAEEVDDVMQETWLAGCRGMSRYNGTAQFFTWIATIGIRQASRRTSERANKNGEVLGDEVDMLEARPLPDTATVMDLENALVRLPDVDRMVVVLHDVEGFSHEEIGRQLDIATGTSRNILSRARAALRTMLNEGGMA